MDEKGVTTELT